MLSFRKAQPEDCDLIFRWANDPFVRKWSYDTEEITFEVHQKWFFTKINSKQTHIFIFFSGDNPIGQVRFEVEGHEAEIGVLVEPSSRGRGYSSEMLKLATEHLYQTQGIKKIIAHIKDENTASIRSFKRAGFVFDAICIFKGHQSHTYIWMPLDCCS